MFKTSEMLVGVLEYRRVGGEGLLRKHGKTKRKGEEKMKIRMRTGIATLGLKEPKPVPDDLQAHYRMTWNQRYNGWNSLQAIKRKHMDEGFRLGWPVRSS